MPDLSHLLRQNRHWAEAVKTNDPSFFETLSQQQRPNYLWIGCADSRVPANQIVDVLPGDLFVHRNVANLVIHTDLNCLSVMQYAVDVLRVEHIIVCGHYGCGGVQAALQDDQFGLIDNWLRHVQDIIKKHESVLSGIDDPAERLARVCELNVIEQVANVGQTTIVRNAWDRGQKVAVHGWIYGLADGLLKDLGISITGTSDVEPMYRDAVAS